ncbi:MAG: 4Fe-4S dicluster domain-containing protein [Terriglobia bacterium]
MNAKKMKADRGRIEVRADECKGCGLCVITCPVHCLEISDTFNNQGYNPVRYLGQGCTGCGICFFVCPEPGALTVYTLAASPDPPATLDALRQEPASCPS